MSRRRKRKWKCAWCGRVRKPYGKTCDADACCAAEAEWWGRVSPVKPSRIERAVARLVALEIDAAGGLLI